MDGYSEIAAELLELVRGHYQENKPTGDDAQ